MNINVNEVFENKLAQLEQEGFIEKLIDESVETTIKKAITEAFESWEVKRKIEDKIKKEIDSSLDLLDFSSYNQFMVDKMNNLIKTAKDVDLNNKIEAMLNEFFKADSSELNLSGLLEEYRKQLIDGSDCGDYSIDDRFGLIIDKEFKYTTYIYIDEKIETGYLSREKHKYQYKYQLQINNETGVIDKLKIDGLDTDKVLRFGFMDNFEGKLVRSYFNKTKINIDVDEDDVDTSLSDVDC